MRVRFYIDGLNLQYGSYPYGHWLDLTRFAERLLEEAVRLGLLHGRPRVDKVKYFSARVSGRSDSAPANQQVYFNALRTLTNVEIVLGHMYSKTIVRPIVSLPIADMPVKLSPPVVFPEGDVAVTQPAGDRVLRIGQLSELNALAKSLRPRVPRLPVFAAVATSEEKGTDVNIAIHMMNDARLELYEVAILCSNDSDLAEAIRMVVEEFGKRVIVVCPPRMRVAYRLDRVASGTLRTTDPMYRKSQFPDVIPGTTVTRPEGLRRAPKRKK